MRFPGVPCEFGVLARAIRDDVLFPGRVAPRKNSAPPPSNIAIRGVRLLVACLLLAGRAVHQLGFLLDELLYPGYREVEIRDPVHVVGIPRSGTTYMHRALAAHPGFTSLRKWELLLAPSVTQKKFFLLLGRLDRVLGSPVGRWLRGGEGLESHGGPAYHPGGMLAHEEDGMLFLWNFTSPQLHLLFPRSEDYAKLAEFDERAPEDLRRRVLAYHHTCLQRHLFVFGEGRRVVSKDPLALLRVRSYVESYPGLRVVAMLRSPRRTVPSNLSVIHANARQRGLRRWRGRRGRKVVDPALLRPRSLAVLAGIAAAYRDQETLLSEALPSLLEVRYAALRESPEALTEVLDFVHAPEEGRDRARASVAETYESQHRYSLEDFGLTETDLVEYLGTTLDRFPQDDLPTGERAFDAEAHAPGRG